MRLILVRHGNTFGPGERVVWVGARTDLPLTEKGHDQARQLGEALKHAKIKPSSLIAGPLKRTSFHAEIAAKGAGYEEPIEIDRRLCEIDYGDWEGKTSVEIEEQYGEASLCGWSEAGRWPKDANWSPDEDEIIRAIEGLAADLEQRYRPKETVMVVSSNGILRYFLKLIPGGFERLLAGGGVKVATGNISLLTIDKEQREILAWNVTPNALSL